LVHEFEAESVETIETKHGPVIVYKLKTGGQLVEMQTETYDAMTTSVEKWLDEQESNRLEWDRLQNDLYPGIKPEHDED